MEKTNTLKVLVIGFFTCLTSVLGIVAVPLYVMTAMSIIDYVTGLMAAKYRGQEIDSQRGFEGILKKICLWLLVLVAFMVDILIYEGAGYVDIVLPVNGFFACLTAIWLAVNEIISILENINDMGIAVPGFLVKITENLKSQIEDKGDNI